uniref:Putative glycosyltransferase n=1 Tax=viral metagenome TaxID=1070528 RepID=A0A6M3M9X2_9ZZZZ
MKIAFFTRNANFAGELLEELGAHHTVRQWRHVNDAESLNWVNIMGYLDWCDLAFFEFVQRPLPAVTRLQLKPACPIVARGHSLDIIGNHDQIDWRRISGLIIPPTQMKRVNLMRKTWAAAHPGQYQPPLPEKILQRYVGVNLEKVPPAVDRDPGYNIILHATVIYDVKRVYLALQCFYDLLQRNPLKPWHLTIIGQWRGGYQWPARSTYVLCVDELIDDLGIPPDRLTIIKDNLPWADWIDLLHQQDIYWCLSYRESFGVSIAEAAASGVYPLVNHYYGAELVWPERNLCRSPSELVRKTIQWGNRPSVLLGVEGNPLPGRKIQLRENIRMHVEKYDSRVINREIRKFCEQILEEFSS